MGDNLKQHWSATSDKAISSLIFDTACQATAAFDRFLLAFIQWLGQYQDEKRARISLECLLKQATLFCGEEGLELDQTTSEPRPPLRRYIDEYCAAEITGERCHRLADTLNIILESFKDYKPEALPASNNDLFFSSNEFGIIGINRDSISSPTNEGPEWADAPEILTFCDLQVRSRIEPPPGYTSEASDIAPLVDIRHSVDSSDNFLVHEFGQKRLLDSKDLDIPRKRHKPAVFLELPPQSKNYRDRRLSKIPLVNHVVGLILDGPELRLWWHDRESTIQSPNIDIRKQLPQLVVLVMLFQRFSAGHWGLHDAFQTSADGPNTISIDGGSFTIDSWRARHDGNMFAFHVSDVSNPERRFFIKASFSEAEKVGEAAMIQKCYTLASGDPMIVDHIPTVVTAQDFPESATSRIRNLLGLLSSRPKLLRILVFERLEPIIKLTGDVFWNAFWDIVRAHFLLWQLGIQHRDISVGNLMHNPATSKGVLNDFDLACYEPESTSADSQCTGTPPFMALELLRARHDNSKIPRRYRHDLESFTWVLLWIFGRYRNGEERPVQFQQWLEDDPYSTKLYYKSPGPSFCSPDYTKYGPAAVKMVNTWSHIERHRQESEGNPAGGPVYVLVEPYVEFADSFYLSCMKHMAESSSKTGECTVNLGIPLPPYPPHKKHTYT
ncbi:hypothetical protein C8J56DRAFT_479643 [Mycena floridula]|nr:hypothetical protein C8J56DRAFT_479643 [Mycena floridula]